MRGAAAGGVRFVWKMTDIQFARGAERLTVGLKSSRRHHRTRASVACFEAGACGFAQVVSLPVYGCNPSGSTP
eukprot:COSAG02_NODE_68_length_42582_cov_52.351129_7_plen_73_part_00